MIWISLIFSFFIFSFSALGMLREQQDTYIFLNEYQNVLASENTQNDNSEKDTSKTLYVILKNVDDEELLEMREYILTDNKSTYGDLIKDLQIQGKLKVFKINDSKNFPQNDNPFVVSTLGGGGVPQQLTEVSNDEISDIDLYEAEVLFKNMHIKGTVNFSNDILEVNDLNLYDIPRVAGTLGGGGTARY